MIPENNIVFFHQTYVCLQYGFVIQIFIFLRNTYVYIKGIILNSENTFIEHILSDLMSMNEQSINVSFNFVEK